MIITFLAIFYIIIGNLKIKKGGGADFSININTALSYDSSDSGGCPQEAISWGKIKPDAKFAKVWCDATIAFPLLVSQTFCKSHPNKQA